jgi:hypothetical protein
LRWVSEWLLFNGNTAILQLYHGGNRLIFNEMMMRSAHWNNRPRIDMSTHSDTLSRFWANQSSLCLLNTTYLAEKQQIPIILFEWFEPTIYRTRGEHTNPYTTDAFYYWGRIYLMSIVSCVNCVVVYTTQVKLKYKFTLGLK